MGSSSRESPAFVKAYDLLKWLLPATAKFPKQQRFVLARHIEEAAFAVHRGLLRAGRGEPGGLAEADLQLATLRTHLRLSCDLRFFSVAQYEHAARLVDELGRLVGGWQRQAAGARSAGQTQAGAVKATTADRGRGVGVGSRSARRFLEQQPDQPPGDEPQQQHAGQPEQQHRVPLRE